MPLLRADVLQGAVGLALSSLLLTPLTGSAATLLGNPTNYLPLLRGLQPGDTLILEPGTYNDPNDVPGLPIFDLNGRPDAPIVVKGPESGPRPVLQGRAEYNTIRLANASYIELRNMEVDGRDLGGDGVKAQGTSHHITLENLLIRGVGSDQQIVGISTNGATTWNWTIRRNVIERAGTGMYLGNSDGSNPFVAGLIEYNLIVDTLGYNCQIKHQNPRPAIPGLPTTTSATIIRHNVLSKANNATMGANARPNLLVGHFPLSGPGASDIYQIYGNFFYQNPTGEALFQGEGNVALYDNLFVNHVGAAVRIQPHNDLPRTIRVFNNTVVASGLGIGVSGGDLAYLQKVIANAVFALSPLQASDAHANVTGSYQSASSYLTSPFAPLGQLDLYPRVGTLTGPPVDSTFVEGFVDWSRDFNGASQTGLFRGAYAGEGQNPGWLPKLEIKPAAPLLPPGAPTNLMVR